MTGGISIWISITSCHTQGRSDAFEDLLSSLKLNSTGNQNCMNCLFVNSDRTHQNISESNLLLPELKTKQELRVKRDTSAPQKVLSLQRLQEVLEGMSQRHSDLSLPRTGSYLKRLGEGGSFHHTCVSRFHAVVHPHTQSEDWIGVWLLYDGWKFDWNGERLRQIHNVSNNHWTL